MTRWIRLVRFMSKSTLTITYLFVITVLAWNVLRFYPGDRWLVVRLGDYFAPWLFMGLVPALIVALLEHRRWLGVATLVALLLFFGRYSYLFTPRPQSVSAETNAGQLKVMTFNVHYSNRNAEDIANLIRAEKPDIIALQEVTDELAAPLLRELDSDYPYSRVESSYQRAPVLISRYPLESQPKPSAAWRSQRAIVMTPSGQITIWNIHPKPAVKPSGWKIQTETIAAVVATLTKVDSPTIVLGDFNATNQAENYGLIAKHLTEVHRAVGQGFGFTFPEPDVVQLLIPWSTPASHMISPIIRIDHIFVSDHFVPQETYVIPHGFGSDHRPVVATLRIVPR